MAIGAWSWVAWPYVHGWQKTKSVFCSVGGTDPSDDGPADDGIRQKHHPERAEKTEW